MGFGPFSSESKASQQTVSPTGGSQAAVGGHALIANPNSVVLGNRANLNLGTDILGGARNIRARSITIDASTPQASSDPALIAALAALAHPGLSSPAPAPVSGPAPATPGTSQPAADNRSLGEKITDSVKNGLSSIRGIFVADNTDGTMSFNKTAWIVLGVVAVLFFAWRRSRR